MAARRIVLCGLAAFLALVGGAPRAGGRPVDRPREGDPEHGARRDGPLEGRRRA